jgi:ABC-type Fe3+ transport system substrate-binding protein
MKMNVKMRLQLILLMLTVILLTACSTKSSQPVITTTPTTSSDTSNKSDGNKEQWEKTWEETLALAKKEGKVLLTGKPGPDREAWVAAFQKKYPEIKTEFTGIRASDFAPRVITEYKNKQHLWDVAFDGSNNAKRSLAPIGILIEDIHDYIILPEIKDDNNWYGGFEEGFKITDSKSLYAFSINAPTAPYVNTDAIPSNFNIDDLIDPKWKGKITIDDPRVPAHGSMTLTAIYNLKGEEFLRKLMIDQQPVYVRNVRQQTEWLATGKYPIGIGIDETYLQVMQKEGVGKNVRKLWKGMEPGIVHGSTIQPFNNPPHPNASKVFVNWALSKEGQEAFRKVIGDEPSRRKDVPEPDPAVFPGWDELMKYKFTLIQEKGMAAMDFVTALAKKVVK